MTLNFFLTYHQFCDAKSAVQAMGEHFPEFFLVSSLVMLLSQQHVFAFFNG